MTSNDEKENTAAEWLAPKLKVWAMHLAARFGVPVLLVGSSLERTNPRDVDVRVVIPDSEFEARYRVSVERWRQGEDAQRWIDDMAHIGRAMVQEYRLNMDFQVHPRSYAERWADRPKLVLAEPSMYLSPI